jgi:tetratricopeptide (TPR) repeat protein
MEEILIHKYDNLPKSLKAAEDDLHKELMDHPNGSALKSGRLFYELGYLQLVSGDFRNARFNIEKALEICVPILTEESEEIVDLYYVYGKILASSKTFADIEKGKLNFVKVLSLREKFDGQKHHEKSLESTLLSEVPKHRLIESTLIYAEAGEVARKKGDFENASLYYSKALLYRRAKFGETSEVIPYLLTNYAEIQVMQGKLSEAKALFNEALPLVEKLCGRVSQDIVKLFRKLALLHFKQNDLIIAEKLLRESIGILQSLYNGEHPDVPYLLNDLAEVYCNMQEYGKAIEYHEAAILAHTKGKESNDALVASFHESMSITLRRQSRGIVKKEEITIGETFDYLRKRTADPKNPNALRYTIDDIIAIAEKFTENNFTEQAVELYDIILGKKKFTGERARVVLPQLNANDFKLVNQSKVHALYAHATKLTTQGELHQARDYLQQCLSAPKDSLKQNSLFYDTIYLSAAENLLQLGNFDDSYQMISESLRARVAKYGTDHLLTLEATLLLANWNLVTSNYDDAYKLTHQSITFLSDSMAKELDSFYKSASGSIVLYAKFLLTSTKIDFERAQYNAAQSTLAQVVALCEKAFEKDHPLVVEVLFYRGVMEQTYGNLKDARTYLEESIAMGKVCFHHNHVMIAQSKKALGVVSILQHQYDRASELLVESLSSLRCQFSLRHPFILENNLWRAKLNKCLGRYEDAYEMMNRIAVDIKKVLVDRHPLSVSCLIELGDVMRCRGYPAPGKELIEDGLQLLDQSTIHILQPEAGYYHAKNAICAGNYDEALKLLEANLDLCRRFMAEHHLEQHYLENNTLLSLAWLNAQFANFVKSKLYLDLAYPLCQLFGEDNYKFSEYLFVLAEFKKHLGRYSDAKTNMARCLTIRYKLFGSDHPLIAETMHNVADIMRYPGYYEEAIRTCSTAVTLRVRLFGESNILTIQSILLLNRIKCDAGYEDISESTLQQALVGVKDVLGYQNIHFLESICHVSECFIDQEKYQIALKALKQCLTLCNAFMNSSQTSKLLVARITDALAYTLYCLKRPYEALVLFKNEVLMVFEDLLGREHPITVCTRSRIGLCLNDIKPGVGQPMIDASLDFFDNYEQSPFSDDHPWVLSLGGYDSESDVSDDEYEHQALTSRQASAKSVISDDSFRPIRHRTPKTSRQILSTPLEIASLLPEGQTHKAFQSETTASNILVDEKSSDFVNDVISQSSSGEAKPQESDQTSVTSPSNSTTRTKKIFSDIDTMLDAMDHKQSNDNDSLRSKQTPKATPKGKRRQKALEAADFLYLRALEIQSTGQYSKASTLFDECLMAREANAPMQEVVSDTLFAQAENFRMLSDFEKANEKYNKCLDIRILYQGRKSLVVADALVGLGNNLFDQGLHLHADSLYQEALTIRMDLLDEDDPVIGFGLYTRGLNLIHLAKYSEAKDLIDQSLVIINKAYGSKQIDISYPIFAEAELLFAQSRFHESKLSYEKALSLRHQFLPFDKHPLFVVCHQGIARCLIQLGSVHEGYKLLAQVLEMQQNFFEAENTRVSETLFHQAEALFLLGKVTNSLTLHRQVLAGREIKLPNKSATVCESSIQLAKVLTVLYQIDEAKSKLKECEKILQELYPNQWTTHPLWADIQAVYGSIYRAAGLYTHSRQSFEKAIEVYRASLSEDTIASLYAQVLMYEARLEQGDDIGSTCIELNQLIQLLKTRLGVEHFLCSYANNIFGSGLRTLGYLDEAHTAMKESLASSATSIAISSLETKYIMILLGLDIEIFHQDSNRFVDPLNNEAVKPMTSKQSFKPVLVKYDEHGFPLFDNNPFIKAISSIEDIIESISRALECPKDSHPVILMMQGQIGVIRKMEYEARRRFILFLSQADREIFKHGQDFLTTAKPSSTIPTAGINATPGVIEINTALEKLTSLGLPEDHVFVRGLRYNLEVVMHQPSEESLSSVENIFAEAERLRRAGIYANADGKYTEALSLQIDILTPIAASMHNMVGDTLYGKAECCRQLGLFEISKSYYSYAVSIYRKAVRGSESFETTKASYGVAELLKAQGLFSDSLKLHEKVLSTRMSLVGSENVLLCESLVAIGTCLLELGKYREAKQMIDKAQGLAQSSSISSLVLSDIYLIRGRIDMIFGNNKSSMEYFEKAYDIRIQEYGSDHHLVAEVMILKAQHKLHTGKFSGAKKLVQEVLRIRVLTFGSVDDEIKISISIENGEIRTLLQTIDDAADNLTLPCKRTAIDTLARDEYHIQKTLAKSISFGLGSPVSDDSDETKSSSSSSDYDDESEIGSSNFSYEGRVCCNHALIADTLRIEGEIAMLTGEYRQAKNSLAFSASIYRALHGESLINGSISSFSASTLYSIANLIQLLGNYEESLRIHNIVLEQRMQVLGDEHIHRAESLKAIAQLKMCYGKYDEAKTCIAASNKILSKIFTKHDTSILIADLYLLQGKLQTDLGDYTSASNMLKKAMLTYQTLYGEVHPSIATAFYQMGQVDMILGQYVNAQKHIEQSLSMRQLLFGEKHVDYLACINAHGEVLQIQGRFLEAKKVTEECYANHCSYIGKRHISTITTLLKLAIIDTKLALYESAKASFLSCHRSLKKFYGMDNLFFAQTISSLGELLKAEASYEQAMALYEQSLAIRRNLLPANHLLISESYHLIAEIFYMEGQYEKCKELYDNSLLILQAIFPVPMQHEAIAIANDGLGRGYLQQGKYLEARNQFERAVSIRKAIYPADHLFITSCSNYHIALIHKYCGKYDHSLSLLQGCLDAQRIAYGSKHPLVATTLQRMSEIAILLADYESAKKWILECQSIRQACYQHIPNHPELDDACFVLAEVYRHLGRYQSSKSESSDQSTVYCRPLYEKTLQRRLEIFPKEHLCVIQAERGLGSCLHALGKYKIAYALYMNALSTYVDLFGDKQVETIEMMLMLADLLKDMSKIYPPEANQASGDISNLIATISSVNIHDLKALDQVDEDSSLYQHLSRILESKSHINERLVKQQSIKPSRPQQPKNVQQSIPSEPKKQRNLSSMNGSVSKTASTNDLSSYNRRGTMGYNSRKPSQLNLLPSIIASSHASSMNALPLKTSSSRLQYDNAKWLCEKALSSLKKIFGGDETHPLFSYALYMKAEVHRQRKHPEHALPLYERALKLQRQLFNGNHHVTIGLIQNALGEVYRIENKHASAYEHYEQALMIFKTFYTSSHPCIADVEGNLAMLFYSQGKYLEASPLFQSSLSIREQVYGSSHPSIAQSLNNFAGLLHTLGKYEEALPMYKRSLEIKIQLYGSKYHADVASSMNNLGLLLKSQKEYNEAEYYYNSALEIQKKLYGEDMNHSHIASTLNNKASLLVAQDRKLEAKELYFQVIEMKRAIYGSDDPAVASSLNNLGGLLFNMGSIEEARVLYDESLRIRRKKYGSDHISVAESLNNIGLLLFSKGSLKEALEYYEDALRIKIAIHGESHPSVASSMHNLAGLLHKMRRLDEAHDWYQKSYQVRRQTYGDDHADTRASQDNMKALEVDKKKLELKKRVS